MLKAYSSVKHDDADSLSDPTMVMTMEVEVEEDCTSTVTSTPIINPATGFVNRSLSANTFPAALPATEKNVYVLNVVQSCPLNSSLFFLQLIPLNLHQGHCTSHRPKHTKPNFLWSTDVKLVKASEIHRLDCFEQRN